MKRLVYIVLIACFILNITGCVQYSYDKFMKNPEWCYCGRIVLLEYLEETNQTLVTTSEKGFLFRGCDNRIQIGDQLYEYYNKHFYIVKIVTQTCTLYLE